MSRTLIAIIKYGLILCDVNSNFGLSDISIMRIREGRSHN